MLIMYRQLLILRRQREIAGDGTGHFPFAARHGDRGLPLADGGDLGQHLGLVVVRRAHNGVAGDADDALIRALERHGLLAAGVDDRHFVR